MNTKQKKQLNKLIAKHVAAQVKYQFYSDLWGRNAEETIPYRVAAQTAAQRLASFIDTLVEKE
ncbi:MAG: hypothetical protein ACRDCE_20475 [Cetobacterium sp.]|uniref:hypothetical protein n=1 Tax=Cetobacterium sp. TaxID=2071632 RepID=UPI003EE7C818